LKVKVLINKYWEGIYERNESTLIMKEDKDLMEVLCYRKKKEKKKKRMKHATDKLLIQR